MSKKINWNDNWRFTREALTMKENTSVSEGVDMEDVTLPHTWNGIDGQDGGNDYYRGTCYYVKKLERSELEAGQEIYMEFEGANSSADLYVNGVHAARHDGGYSTWRVNITELLKEQNEIVVAVDNAPNDFVYPQQADFTFYGGLYRTVSILCVPSVRFDLDYYGSPAIKVTPRMTGKDAQVIVETFVTGAAGTETIVYSLMDEGEIVEERTVSVEKGSETFVIENAHLWNGTKDPHLYTMKAVLKSDGEILDERMTRFGCRSSEIDPEKGFILNGESYPLRGVSRHQDRPDIGNALLPEHHREDVELICEMGATTIRLAHYQHDQYFYDLCDEKGLVIWAEIPYISKHMPKGRENTVSQMKELIAQNYNHPCIVVWGLSNEITMAGAADADLLENHNILNDLCHEMDPTRKTTVAVVSMCNMDDEYVRISDVISYNHYFGWYGGDTSMNGPFMDQFHAKYPETPIGMSEYGCEALNWHNSNPQQGDYSEEYQNYYHEELIKQLYTRPFVWATHVWNMFDFAADARAEGGEDGMNHKGLVTFDRKYRKDAFYAYKAWLSEDPFVHICSKRYVDRVEEVTKVTVYSNLPQVELLVNGKHFETQESAQHFFYFEVPNEGITKLTAKAGNCQDESEIHKVDTFNEAYRMKELIGGDVLNWFDITEVEGCFSINDKMGDILKNPEGQKLLGGMLSSMMPKEAAGMDLSGAESGMMLMLNGFTFKRMVSMIGTMGADVTITKDDILKMNAALNQIHK